MSRAIPFIVVWLFAFHTLTLALVLKNPEKKEEAQSFIRSVFAMEDETVAEKPAADPMEPFQILSPFAGDRFTFRAGQHVQFAATHAAQWFVDGAFVAEGRDALWPMSPGRHVIQAFYSSRAARLVTIEIQ